MDTDSHIGGVPEGGPPDVLPAIIQIEEYFRLPDLFIADLFEGFLHPDVLDVLVAL